MKRYRAQTLLIAGPNEQIVGYKAGENRILTTNPRMDAVEVEFVPAEQLAGAVDVLRGVLKGYIVLDETEGGETILLDTRTDPAKAVQLDRLGGR